MSVVDALLLAAVFGVGGAQMLGLPRSRQWRIRTVFGLAALSALQLVTEGYYWQFAPAYFLVGLISALLFLQSGIARHPVNAGVALALLLSAGMWTFLPVPELTRPAGPYSVGTRVFRWVDTNRAEDATADTADRRNVVVQLWYPADSAAGGHSTYMDGLDALPPYVGLLPRFVFRHYDRINTNGVTGAAISTRQSKWPVIVFSPGYGAPRAFYTSVVTGLASGGYVVMAVDHPYEAAVTELADGRVVTTVEKFSDTDPDRTAFMTQHLEIRVADVRFVLDRVTLPDTLPSGLERRLDMDRITAMGHSFGGATAVLAMHRDPRIKAAANIDGTLYGDISAMRLRRPLLLLESDHAETGHSERYLSGNARLLENTTARADRRELTRTSHYSFTDAPLLLTLPARWLLSRFVGGGRDATEVHRTTVDILTEFMEHSRNAAGSSD